MAVDEKHDQRQSLGHWLIENMPGLGEIEAPPRHEERERPVPFADWTEDEWEAFDRKHGTRSSPVRPGGSGVDAPGG